MNNTDNKEGKRWEAEFEEVAHHCYADADFSDMRTFIHSLLKSQAEEVVVKLETLKIDYPKSDDEFENGEAVGHNAALVTAMRAIKEKYL